MFLQTRYINIDVDFYKKCMTNYIKKVKTRLRPRHRGIPKNRVVTQIPKKFRNFAL